MKLRPLLQIVPEDKKRSLALRDPDQPSGALACEFLVPGTAVVPRLELGRARDRISREKQRPRTREPDEQREMARRVSRGQQKDEPRNELLVAVDQVVAARSRPGDGSERAEVAWRAELELRPADDDRRGREAREIPDVIDVAVCDDEVGDVVRLEARQGELGRREVVARHRDDVPEGIEPLLTADAERIGQIASREPRVDEHDPVTRDGRVSRERNDAVALGDFEAAVVECEEFEPSIHRRIFAHSLSPR